MIACIFYDVDLFAHLSHLLSFYFFNHMKTCDCCMQNIMLQNVTFQVIIAKKKQKKKTKNNSKIILLPCPGYGFGISIGTN